MKPKRSMLIIAGIALLGAAGTVAYFTGAKDGSTAQAASGGHQSGPPPAIVHISEAVSADLAPLSEAPGSVVSVRDSLIAAATAGKIEWVEEVGVEVEEGAVIARIDKADAEFLRDTNAAEVRRLVSRAEYLARLYERFESLGDDAGESEASLDEMRVNRDEARQNLQRARVALRQAETTLERTKVRAPFIGRIVSREIQVGEYANPGAAIARLVDTQTLEVTAQAPATLLNNIKAGDTVRVSNGREEIKAPVRAIVPVGNEISRTLELRLALTKTNWHIGSAVRVHLPTAAVRRVIAGHRDALVLRANRVSVFTIDAENKAKQIDVELGSAEGDLIELVGDIKPGDALIIRGGERLRDGQTVEIREPAAVAAAS